MTSLFKISKFITVPILVEWLTIEDIITFDTAVCNEERNVLITFMREFPKLFQSSLFPSESCIPLSLVLFEWAKIRGFHIQNIVSRVIVNDNLISSFRFNNRNSKYVQYFRSV